jgi:hypothetical protein
MQQTVIDSQLLMRLVTASIFMPSLSTHSGHQAGTCQPLRALSRSHELSRMEYTAECATQLLNATFLFHSAPSSLDLMLSTCASCLQEPERPSTSCDEVGWLHSTSSSRSLQTTGEYSQQNIRDRLYYTAGVPYVTLASDVCYCFTATLQSRSRWHHVKASNYVEEASNTGYSFSILQPYS